MIDRAHPTLSVSRQCQLLDVSRASVYRRPAPVSGDVPADVANGRALLINDYAASPVQARAPSLVGVAEGAA